MRNLEDMVRRVLVAIEMPATAAISAPGQSQQPLDSRQQQQLHAPSKQPESDDLPVSRSALSDEDGKLAGTLPEAQSAELKTLLAEREALRSKLQGANDAIEVEHNQFALWLV